MGVIRIAMWSGPRNISTAMMRSFGSRVDCAVTDEPLYAHYLSTLDASHRLQHPAHEAVIVSQPTDWRDVARALTGRPPGGSPIWYQKHMAHHVTSAMETGWIQNLTNCFLIRRPVDMVASFVKVIERPTARDLGLPQQMALFRTECERRGDTPPVVDCDELLRDPEGVLRQLCERVGIEFDDAMLSWTPGLRQTDGVWAEHWYGNVIKSTGFGPPRDKAAETPVGMQHVVKQCDELYWELFAHRLRARPGIV